MNDQVLVSEYIQKVNDGKVVAMNRLGGLTNRSYKVELDNGNMYVVRLPGEGTSELINRHDEKISTQLACDLNVDTQLLYFDDEGVKISAYIENAITCDAAKLREEKSIMDVANIFHTLHTSNVDTGVKFEVFEMAKSYEDIISKYNVAMYEDYHDVKAKVMKIKAMVDAASTIQKVPCHNDSLCENWIYGKDCLYLIDWEYAGMNDGLWDLADVSIEADYSEANDDLLLASYFGRTPTSVEKHRFIANKLYLDYLWTLWGKTRVPFDGQPMEEYALQRYIRLKKNIEIFEKN